MILIQIFAPFYVLVDRVVAIILLLFLFKFYRNIFCRKNLL